MNEVTSNKISEVKLKMQRSRKGTELKANKTQGKENQRRVEMTKSCDY